MNEQEHEQPEPITQFFEQLAEGLVCVAKTVEKVAEEFVEHVAVPMCNAMQDAYREAGSPFGDSPEGLLAWMQMLSAINRRKQELEHKRIQRELMLDAVRLGEEIRRSNT